MRFEELTPYQQKQLLKALELIIDTLYEIYPIIIKTMGEIIELFINAFIELGKELEKFFDNFDWEELKIIWWWNQYKYLRGM